MEKVDLERENMDVENQRIGRNFIGCLNLLSPQSQKTLDYVYKIKEGVREKERANTLLIKKIKMTMDLQKKEPRLPRNCKKSSSRNKSMMNVLTSPLG